jgi:hypothetical protein
LVFSPQKKTGIIVDVDEEQLIFYVDLNDGKEPHKIVLSAFENEYETCRWKVAKTETNDYILNFIKNKKTKK